MASYYKIWPMYYTPWRSFHTRHPCHCPTGTMGNAGSQARTVTYLLYHFNPFFMDREQETAQQTEDTKSTGTKRERCDSTISFRVSKTQREHIGRLADKCGMTLSDYVLARSYNYRPKARLTPRQEAVRDELIMARSDYARYTSMLNAMPQEERRADVPQPDVDGRCIATARQDSKSGYKVD